MNKYWAFFFFNCMWYLGISFCAMLFAPMLIEGGPLEDKIIGSCALVCLIEFYIFIRNIVAHLLRTNE